MNVFFKEGLDFRFIIGKSVGLDCDDVSVGVTAIVADLVEFGIDGVFGIPGDGDFGIFVGGCVEFPVALSWIECEVRCEM